MFHARPVLASLAFAVPAAVVPAAEAAFPGGNGQIVYSAAPAPDRASDVPDGALRLIGPTGAGDRLWVDNDAFNETEASFDPSGVRLAWAATADAPASGLYVGPVRGGGAQIVVKSGYADAPAWSPDGRTLVYADYETGLRTVAADGSGTPATVVRNGKRLIYGAPAFAPGGQALLYVRFVFNGALDGFKRSELWTAGLDGSGARLLLGGSGAFKLTGDPDVSPDGTHLAVVAGRGARTDTLYVTAPDGTAPRAVAVAGTRRWFSAPAWSPDGTRIVVSRVSTKTGGGSELVTVDPASGTQTVLRRAARAWLGTPSWQPLPAA